MTSLVKKLLFHRRPRLPCILQDEVAECGHACIAMISQFFGHQLDLAGLRKIAKPSLKGVNLRDMMELFDHLGFESRALRVALEELYFVKSPAILHWNMNHFVVLKKVGRHRVTIHDPAIGIRHLTWPEVSKAYTGIVLEVEKSVNFKMIKSRSKLTLVDLVKLIGGVKSFISCLLLLSLSIECLNLASPLFMQYVTDQVVSSSDHHNLPMLTIGFMILVGMQACSELIRGNMVLYLRMHLTEKFTTSVMRHLFQLPLHFFMARNKGDLQSKINSIHEIQRKVGVDLVTMILDGVMMILNLSVMLVYSRVLTSIVILILGVYIGARYLSFRMLKAQMTESTHRHAQVASIFLESLQAILPIKAFLKEQAQLKVWGNQFIDALNSDIRVERMHVLYQGMGHLLLNLEYIGVVCIGALFVVNHELSLGMLFAFLAYRQLLVSKSSSFIQHWFDYQLITIQLDRLNDIVSEAPEFVDVPPISPQAVDHQNIRGELVLQNVAFQYDAMSPMIFQGIDLSIQPGEKVAIIGASGRGKSTLLKLMMGLLMPTHGEILIDGMPLQQFGYKQYRLLTAAVMQEDALFSGSLVDNITFFDDEVNWEWVYTVAQLACIHETIVQFPMGYQTRVGDMGSSLSGGQKQRVLLARALYKKPKILFLDEATSHLDQENEQRMNQALAQLNITQVIVAHREETIRMADRVVDLFSSGRAP